MRSLVVERLDAILEALTASSARERWPKTVAEYADYLGRTPRAVQKWISDRRIRVNPAIRPAMITKAASDEFLAGGISQ